MSKIREFLDQMLSEAELPAKEGTNVAEPAGGYGQSSARTADKSGSLPAKEGTKVSVTSGEGGSTKRSADKSGTLPAKEGTKVWEPTETDETSKYVNAEDTVYGKTVAEQEEGEAGPESAAEKARKAARMAEMRASIKKYDDKKSAERAERRRMDEALESLVEFRVDLDSLKDLMESQELSEEFQIQAVELIEAAVTDIARQHLEKIYEAADEFIEEEIEAEVAVLEEEVESYLDHVVAEWVEQNQVAIQSSIRTEIAESFMTQMKQVLEAHNIDLPESKVDLYEEAIARGQEVADLYEAEVERVAELQEQIRQLQKAEIVESVAAGLVETQADKLRSLAESIEFTEDFAEKLETLRESYVKTKQESTLTEDFEPVVEEVVVEAHVDPEIAALAKSVSRWAGR